MTTVGDVIEIISDCRQFEQDVKNVFHYFFLSITALGDIVDVLVAFKAQVLDEIISDTGDTVFFEQLRIKNLTDPNEFGILQVQELGAQAGDQLPSFVAAGVLLTPNSAATRPGSKRFAGIRESDQDDGVFTAGGLGLWDDIEAPLITIIGSGPTFSAPPIILGRFDDGTYDLSRYSGIISATVKEDLTSQTSRKKGKGA